MAEILVIDDDPVIRRFMVTTLSAAGHTIREAPDGAHGMAAFRTHHPDLVITDIVMPEKEGIEVIREVRKEAPDVAILAVSGSAHGSFYLHAATVLGADASLAKPFRSEEFLRVVSDLLTRSRRHAYPTTLQSATDSD
jgi:DNA-binding response OmpR family regulator